MDAVSQYLNLVEKELQDYIQPEVKAESDQLQPRDCKNCSTADAARSILS